MNEIHDLNRGIVLMHDVHSRTIDMAKLMVKELKQEGYDFIRADEAPSVVAALQRRSDVGGQNPPTPANYTCAAGFSPTPVGQAGAFLCLSDKEAQGPFTQGMQDACREKGGGDSCANVSWSRGMAVWVHGADRCPLGASFDSDLNACVEGDNAFGPFSKEQVSRCKELSANPDSPVCAGNRWGRRFLADVNRR